MDVPCVQILRRSNFDNKVLSWRVNRGLKRRVTNKYESFHPFYSVYLQWALRQNAILTQPAMSNNSSRLVCHPLKFEVKPVECAFEYFIVGHETKRFKLFVASICFLSKVSF